MRQTTIPSSLSLCLAAAAVVMLILASPVLAAEYASIAKNDATVRSGPDIKKEALWTLFKGYPVQIVTRKGNWAQIVDFEGDKGWIATSLLSKEKTAIIKVSSANLRTGAGTDYEIVAEAKQGVVFKTVASEKGWVKVKHADGTIGWVLGKLLWPN